MGLLFNSIARFTRSQGVINNVDKSQVMQDYNQCEHDFVCKSS